MVVNVTLKKEYIPEWNGNREAEDKIVVSHLSPTMALYEELIPKPKIKMRVGPEGAQGGETELTVDTVSIVKRMVTGIKNLVLEVNDGKERIVISTANELFGADAPAMLAGLTDELGRYFQELLTSRNVNGKN